MSAAAPLIDAQVFDALQENVGADFVVELVETFNEEAPGLIAELRRALAAGDAIAFRRAAHALKSNGNTFGASHFAEQARALELGGLPADPTAVDALDQEFKRTLAALKERARA